MQEHEQVGQRLVEPPSEYSYNPGDIIFMQQAAKGSKQGESVHQEPKKKELHYLTTVPESVQLHVWDYFQTEDSFAPESIVMQDETLHAAVTNLNGRRRPWDGLLYNQPITEAYELVTGKPMLVKISRSLQTGEGEEARTRTVYDILSLSPEEFASLEKSVEAFALRDFLHHYVDYLAISPHLRAVSHLFGTVDQGIVEKHYRSDLPQVPIPADQEAQIAARVEAIFASATRSPLVAARMIDYFGLNDGKVKTYTQVGKNFDVTAPTIKNNMENVGRKVRNRVQHYRSLPRHSLATIMFPDAVVLNDIPMGDVPYHIDSDYLDAYGPLINQTKTTLLSDLFCADMDLLTPEEETTIRAYLAHHTSQVDFMRQQDRFEQVVAQFKKEQAANGLAINNLFPELTSEQIAHICNINLRHILPRGILTALQNNYRSVRATKTTIQSIALPQEIVDLVGGMGQAEERARTRELTIGDILELPEQDYVAMRNLGQKGVNTMKQAIIEEAFSLQKDLEGDFLDATTVDDYLERKRQTFLYYPSRSDNEYKMITDARQEYDHTPQNAELAKKMLDADINRLRWTQKKYEWLEASCDIELRTKLKEVTAHIGVFTRLDQKYLHQGDAQHDQDVIDFRQIIEDMKPIVFAPENIEYTSLLIARDETRFALYRLSKLMAA